MLPPKNKQRVIEINSGFIAAQSALGGHFVFFIISFQAFFLNDRQERTLTLIFYFDSRVGGLLAFAISTEQCNPS
jgi:hypothetical protein